MLAKKLAWTEKMKDKYEFVAIFEYAEDGISIRFPDIPGCLSCADTTEEALKNAQDALGLALVHFERENLPIPSNTPIEKIECEKDERAFIISVWMPLARKEVKDIVVKKTLTIPKWLNDLAEAENVNFSKILNSALQEYLKTKRIL